MNLHISLNESGYPVDDNNQIKLPNIQALKDNSFHHKSGQDFMTDYSTIRFKKKVVNTSRHTDS
jgi:hypothetical protein